MTTTEIINRPEISAFALPAAAKNLNLADIIAEGQNEWREKNAAKIKANDSSANRVSALLSPSLEQELINFLIGYIGKVISEAKPKKKFWKVVFAAIGSALTFWKAKRG